MKWYDLRTHFAVPPVERFHIKGGNRICVQADQYRELTEHELDITRKSFLYYKDSMDLLKKSVSMRDFPAAYALQADELLAK